MAATSTSVPPAIYLLADHLDAILAAGEDLLALKVDIEGARKSDGAAAPWVRFEGLIASARMLELTMISRGLQARRRVQEVAREVARNDAAIGAVLGVFVGGTAALEDAVAELAERNGADFDAGLDPLAYLRTRGLIAADAGTLSGARSLEVTEAFLVARRIELGPLLDLAAALLDALEAAYGLFEEANRVRPASEDEPAREEAKSQGRGQAWHSVDT